MIPLINCATSFFAGFAIFGVLGYMAELKGVEVEDVAASGKFYSPDLKRVWIVKCFVGIYTVSC